MYEEQISFLTHEIERRELVERGELQGSCGAGSKWLADFCEEMKAIHGSIWPRLVCEAMWPWDWE